MTDVDDRIVSIVNQIADVELSIVCFVNQIACVTVKDVSFVNWITDVSVRIVSFVNQIDDGELQIACFINQIADVECPIVCFVNSIACIELSVASFTSKIAGDEDLTVCFVKCVEDFKTAITVNRFDVLKNDLITFIKQINMAKTTITIDKIIEDANRIKILNDSYLFSYPHFKRYFTDIKGDFTEHDLIIGIHFIYGWMPTIFEFKNGKTGKESIFEDKIIRKNISEAVEIVNKIRREDYVLIDSDYGLLKKLFNNSLVGTSKFLHFVSPNKFAIWDSNVFLYFNDDKIDDPYYSYRNEIENVSNYRKYLQNLENFKSEDSKFEEIQEKIKEKLLKIGYTEEISKLRTLELIMFTIVRKLKVKSKASQK